ncbi:MAG: FeoB-associated Cys-rich membrane protein [Peptostreptococcaceae bacterium]|nr:FeoB-associated Cys-rich membrane protein [Peptostreptococcaceae bacterium]
MGGLNLPTLIVGLIFAAIIFFAARKSFQDAKAGKCASCNCGCEEKAKKDEKR